MAVASKLTSIGIIALSLGIGILFFYVFSDTTKEQKKKQLEEFISQLINFVIFIWLGKIVLNLSQFISDPIPTLAYPSDSKAFYFAIVLIAFVLFYKTKRKNLNVLLFMDTFTYIFLISSFVYEFIQLVVNDNPFALGYLLLLGIIIGIFLFLRERLSVTVLLMVMVTIWSIGMVVLASVQPFVTVFGYMMAPWFVLVIFIMSISSLAYQFKKGDA